MVDQRTINAILRQDLGAFTVKAFQTVSPGTEYKHNWHIDAIVHELLNCHEGENRRLIITQPPRSLKSICSSVAFPAWALGHDPSRRFACVSYSNDLAAFLARQFRTVMTSDWYRALFPNVRLKKDTETECETTQGGGRFALSVGGSFTGRGADVIIIDDPLKADDAHSEKARRAVNEWYGTTLLSRLDDKGKGVIALVMQRLHEDDLAGRHLAESGWRHLDLPAIAIEDQTISLSPTRVHHRRKDEVLHPERESREVLKHIKREIGSLTFSAQYQQRPIPVEGNLVKRKWINWFDTPPERALGREIVQSWDIATSTGATNDWSVCTTWMIIKRDYYLLHVWRGRLEFPDLRKKVIRLATEQKPNTLLIERVGPGQNLIQELRDNPIPGVPTPIGIRPEKAKLVRMEIQAARFEANQVHMPKEAPWLADLLNELFAFPGGRYDDQVDSVSQFLNWVEQHEHYSGRAAIAGPWIAALHDKQVR